MKYLDFEEVKLFARKNNIKSAKEWFAFKKPENIPSFPCGCKAYKGFWKSWGDFLGNGKIANSKKAFLCFNKARTFVRSLKIKSISKWREYCKSGKKPYFIPSVPGRIYKEWGGWNDWLNTNNLTGDRKYSVNNKFFKEKSGDMYYILGLWWADGCISGNRFHLCFQRSDEYILKNIGIAMGSNYPIYRYKNSSMLLISSKEIVADIKEIGGTERKSLTCIFPNIPEKFLADFVRGAWDGDGCIWKHKKSYLSSIVSGSKTFIDGLYKRLLPHVAGKVYNRKTQIGTIRHDLVFSTNKTRILRDFIYNGHSTLCLERKRKMFFDAGCITKLSKAISIDDAKKIVCSLNIKSCREWIRRRKEFLLLGVPVRPDRVYKNRGWKGWQDFLSRRIL